MKFVWQKRWLCYAWTRELGFVAPPRHTPKGKGIWGTPPGPRQQGFALLHYPRERWRSIAPRLPYPQKRELGDIPRPPALRLSASGGRSGQAPGFALLHYLVLARCRAHLTPRGKRNLEEAPRPPALRQRLRRVEDGQRGEPLCTPHFFSCLDDVER
jgi:hypothetical protein